MDKTSPKISFASATPQNNSKTSKNFAFINLSSSEILSKIILEWNGTNESMYGDALSYYKNKTGLDNNGATYSYRVYANDSSGNMELSDMVFFTINNSAPFFASFYPNFGTLNISEPPYQFFNITYGDLDNDSVSAVWYKNGSIAALYSNFSIGGNFSSEGFYNITVEISDGNLSRILQWNLTIINSTKIPIITSINLTNTDFLNRTNGTLLGFFAFFDSDGNSIEANETLWYINNTLMIDFNNKTYIGHESTTKLENWTFSARIFNGLNWSEFKNSSTITISNSHPSIKMNTSSVEILETQVINISMNAKDLDGDNLIFFSNISQISFRDDYLAWRTNLSSGGFHTANITVNDSTDTDFAIITIIIDEARDLDNDGIADFNDSDMDNDGILNENDFLVGNLSEINSNIALNMSINGTSNLSAIFNGTFLVSISNTRDPIIEFYFTFNSSSILDLGNMTINRSKSGFGAVWVKGIPDIFNNTKTFYIEKINFTAKSVCIKDADASIEDISSSCDSSNETLVACDNSTSRYYTCFDTGSRYKIAGLHHSAAKEQCTDADGDLYGAGCALGNDCDDNDNSKTASCATASQNPSSSSSGASGGTGGGGGSGGASALFVCNMDWKCSDWSECRDGFQYRQCDFVKVPQHAQDTQCKSSAFLPVLNRVCESPKKEQNKGQAQSSSSGEQKNEQQIASAPAAQKDGANQAGLNQATGFAVSNSYGKKTKNAALFAFTGLAVVILFLFFLRNFKIFRKRK